MANRAQSTGNEAGNLGPRLGSRLPGPEAALPQLGEFRWLEADDQFVPACTLMPMEPTPVAWRVVLLAAGGARVVHGQRLELRDWPTEHGVAEVALSTRFEDVGLPEPLPRELVLEVRCQARDTGEAIERAAAAGANVAPLLSFAINAHVAVPTPYVAFEAEPGLTSRRFWQGHVALESGLPRVGRRLDESLLFPFLKAVLTSSERTRLARALGQYDVALHHWTVPARPLALAHLYIALEALAPAVERVERERLGLPNDRAHARHRGVDVGRGNWKDVLLGWVRRDVICGGDKETYDIARAASDGFEHAAMDFPTFRAAANRTSAALMGYVRRGVLSLVDLPEATRQELADKSPLDVSPLQFAVQGELTGEVQDPDRLGYGGQPYPYADWQITLDDHRQTPDGRHRLFPRHHLTARIAEGAQLAYVAHAIGAGMTDPDLLDYQP
jgi:hypothetical protein